MWAWWRRNGSVFAIPWIWWGHVGQRRIFYSVTQNITITFQILLTRNIQDLICGYCLTSYICQIFGLQNRVSVACDMFLDFSFFPVFSSLEAYSYNPFYRFFMNFKVSEIYIKTKCKQRDDIFTMSTQKWSGGAESWKLPRVWGLYCF